MSSTKHLLDPELRAMADGPFLQDLDDAKVARVRKVMAEQTPALSDPIARGLYRKEVFVPQNNAPDVRCLLYGAGHHACLLDCEPGMEKCGRSVSARRGD